MLSFENDQFMGAEAIGNKLNVSFQFDFEMIIQYVKMYQSLPFRKVIHSILTMDIQPSGCGGIIIVVCVWMSF